MCFKKYILMVIIVVSVFSVDKYNYIFLQKINSAFLIDIHQSSRVFPHRVNSIGKLQDIWKDGIRSFEVDILYGYSDPVEFQVGHDNEAIGGVSLEELLLSINYQEIDRVWLDLKNLNVNNYLKVIQRLEYLEKKFKIKNKALLESGITLPFFRELSKEGWRTSYYLPTSQIMKLLGNNDALQLQQMASKIAYQSEVQELSAISFDDKLYTFTKSYLEPLISSDLEYHTWWGPPLKKYNFRSRLLSNEQFLDQRVRTILVKYKSTHHI